MRRYLSPPARPPAQAGMIMGGIFVLIGLTVVIPQAGAWTIMALVITVVNGTQAFGTKYFGPELHIEDEGGSGRAVSAMDDRDPKVRIGQLER